MLQTQDEVVVEHAGTSKALQCNLVREVGQDIKFGESYMAGLPPFDVRLAPLEPEDVVKYSATFAGDAQYVASRVVLDAPWLIDAYARGVRAEHDLRLERALAYLRTTPHQRANRDPEAKRLMKSAVRAIEELEVVSPTEGPTNLSANLDDYLYGLGP